jgi:cell shape-determining protein MreD
VAATSGFVAGMFFSLITYESLGPMSATLVLIAYLTGHIRRKVSLDNPTAEFATVMVALIFQNLLLIALSLVLEIRFPGLNLFGCLLTALAFLALFPMLRKAFPRTRSVDLYLGETVSEI